MISLLRSTVFCDANMSDLRRMFQQTRRGFAMFMGLGLLSTSLVGSTESLAQTEDVQQPSILECPATGQSSVTASAPVQLVSQLVTPQTQIERVLNTVGPMVMAYVNPQPWPQLHPRSEMARVPVMMYHDILPEKEVFFDVTPEELREDFELIRDRGLTPISLDQLVSHLRTGMPLPEKPILLTFDDGYVGHYEHVLPMMEEFGYPAVFSIFPAKPNGDIAGRSTLTWEQLQEMTQNPLVTIASHSVTHPRDLRDKEGDELVREVVDSKQELEAKLGIPIRYFTYPEGKYDETVLEAVEEAGYVAALTMDDVDERFAGDSESLLAISRFGQSQLENVVEEAWGGPPAPTWGQNFNFDAEVQMDQTEIDEIALVLVSGGKPITIHADSRYQVSEIIANTDAIAAVDGGFFSLKYLDSNVMIGPVLSQYTGDFVPGYAGELGKLVGRPLVLISSDTVKFIEFDPGQHNTLDGVQAELPNVSDVFVAAAWLVKDGEPQLPESFKSLFDFDAYRHRAFWGINQSGQPVIGVTTDRVDSVSLGQALVKAGLRDAVMLDSGASTSLVYQQELMVGYVPRPVPHVVALLPPKSSRNCPQITAQQPVPYSQN